MGLPEKSKEQDIFYAWFFMRRISRRLVPLATLLRLTPNQITIASIVLDFVSITLFQRGEISTDFIGLLILQLSFLLDCLDGDLARHSQVSYYGKQGNLAGKYLDYSRELIFPTLVPISLAMNLPKNDYNHLVLLIVVLGTTLRIVPQLTREHVIVSEFRKGNRTYFSLLQSKGIFADSLQLKGPQRTLFKNRVIRGAKSIFGFPGGLMNTTTAAALAGLVTNQDYYYHGKAAILLIAASLYIVNCLYTYVLEFRKLSSTPGASAPGD